MSKTVDGEITYFVNDLNQRYEQVVQTYNDEGVIDTYTYGLQRINSKGETNETYLYDGRGSVVGAVGNGNDFVSYSYTAYGELMPNSPTPTVFGYNAEATDFKTGMQYLRARYYDTIMGRFFQEDDYRGKFTKPSSMNRYAYTHNNPVMGIDPSGYYTASSAGMPSNIVMTSDGYKPRKNYVSSSAGIPSDIEEMLGFNNELKQNLKEQEMETSDDDDADYPYPEYPGSPDNVSQEALKCMEDLLQGEDVDVYSIEDEVLLDLAHLINGAVIEHDSINILRNDDLGYMQDEKLVALSNKLVDTFHAIEHKTGENYTQEDYIFVDKPLFGATISDNDTYVIDQVMISDIGVQGWGGLERTKFETLPGGSENPEGHINLSFYNNSVYDEYPGLPLFIVDSVLDRFQQNEDALSLSENIDRFTSFESGVELKMFGFHSTAGSTGLGTQLSLGRTKRNGESVDISFGFDTVDSITISKTVTQPIGQDGRVHGVTEQIEVNTGVAVVAYYGGTAMIAMLEQMWERLAEQGLAGQPG